MESWTRGACGNETDAGADESVGLGLAEAWVNTATPGPAHLLMVARIFKDVTHKDKERKTQEHPPGDLEKDEQERGSGNRGALAHTLDSSRILQRLSSRCLGAGEEGRP